MFSFYNKISKNFIFRYIDIIRPADYHNHRSIFHMLPPYDARIKISGSQPDICNCQIKINGVFTKVNILFFLTPKSEVAYIFENETLRQTLEKMEHSKFSCIPLLSLDGKYTGTISEGDLLWGMKTLNVPDLKTSEGISIMAVPRRATYKAVHANSNMEDLLDKAINQNYVPVVDDQGYFIGIITRKEIIKYCYKELKKYAEASETSETSASK